MPYCTRCGTPVNDPDLYCPKCAAPQGSRAGREEHQKTDMTPRSSTSGKPAVRRRTLRKFVLLAALGIALAALMGESMKLACLVVLCIFGRFVLCWRREARSGFGLGLGNAPGIFKFAIGDPLVWLIGQIAFWGAIAGLLRSFDWYWSIFAIILALVVQRPLVALSNR